MKQYWLFIFLFIVACNRAPQSSDSVAVVVADDTAVSPSKTATSIPSPTHTPTPLPTNTPRITPTLPHTATPTLTPTLTPTPKPITHANIGWEGVEQESRQPFPDEMRIKSEILEQYQNNQFFSSVTEEDINIVWYTVDDGTVLWQPYFTLNNSHINDDLFLYIFPLTTDSSDTLSLPPFPKILNISAMEQLGYIDNITDIQLTETDDSNKSILIIERNGARLWYSDELNHVLILYDQDISAFGLPEKPEPASDFVVVMHVHHAEDAYLFRYDATAIATAGISEPNAGPIYELKNNQWRSVDNPEFIGGGSPQIAYIGYDSSGNGHLYIEELTNYQTSIEVWSNIHTPLAPAAMVYDEMVSNMNSFDYYYVLASPVWSPDDRHIAFIAEEDELPFLATYDVDTQTWQSLVQLPENPELFLAPIWSPDGDWLLYGYRNAGSTSYRLKTISYPDGVVYTIDQGWNPQWIQDEGGLRLNYSKSSDELFMANPDGSNIESMEFAYQRPNVYPQSSYNLLNGYAPEHDAFLIYRTHEEDGMDKLLYAPLDGGEEIILAELPTENDVYRYSKFMFSPDKNWLMALKHNTQDEQLKVYIQNLQTQESREEPFAFMEGWTPDSKGVIEFTTMYASVYDAVTGDLAYNIQPPFRIARSIWGNSGILHWPDE